MESEPVTETGAIQRVSAVFFYGFVLLLAWLVFLIFRPFLTPLTWAGILVILFQPLDRWLEERLGRTGAAAVSTLVATLVLLVPVSIVVVQFVRQALELMAGLEPGALPARVSGLAHAWDWVVLHFPAAARFNVVALLQSAVQRITTELAAELASILRHLLVVLFDLLITIVALFYFFRDGPGLMAAIRRALPFAAGYREQMIAQARELVFTTVLASLVVSGINGLIGGTMFAIVGIPRAVFWGVVMGFFALLPVLGAWMVWAPAGIWLIGGGRVGAGLAVLIVCGVSMLTVDNVLRPLLIGGRAQLNGLLVLIGVLGGLMVFGLLGVVLGPVIVATAVGFLHAYTLPAEQPTAATPVDPGGTRG